MDGIIYSEDSIIRDKAVQFYETIYMETKDCRPFVDDLSFSRIDDMDRNLLDSLFERDEIHQVVKDL